MSDKSLPVQEPRFQDVIDVFDAPFVIIDKHYRVVAANRKYSKHYNISHDQITGKLCHEVSHHSEVPCSQNGEACPLEMAMQSGQLTEVMHAHYDKQGNLELVELRAKPIHDADGNIAFIGESIYPIVEKDCSETQLVGRSPYCLRLVSLLQRVAPTQTIILLEGESGVGKEQVAHYIHHYSTRSQGPFVVVDCGALGENLIESELFGYEKAAFTGAERQKIGLFEAAQGGTLFIDEIGDLPLELQTKLLRVLETGKIRRIGGTNYIKINVRVIAATHRDLKAMVANSRFREDLYYRLSAFPIQIPSLRQRKDDIPLLAEHFLYQIEGGEAFLPLSPEVIQKLLSYDYPGNIRELRNIMERASILAGLEGVITTEHIHIIEMQSPTNNAGSDATIAHQPLPTALLHRRGSISDELILQTLQECQGHRACAARQLGVSERTLYRRLQSIRASTPKTE